MIQKYKFGKPFETEAVVRDIPCAEGMPKYGNINLEKGFRFTYEMQEKDMVYGLGEANRGINKRGFVYISNCTDAARAHRRQKVSVRRAQFYYRIRGRNLWYVCGLPVCFDF